MTLLCPAFCLFLKVSVGWLKEMQVVICFSGSDLSDLLDCGDVEWTGAEGMNGRSEEGTTVDDGVYKANVVNHTA